MAISQSLVSELRRRLDWPVEMLRQALKAGGGDVDKALLHAIDRGIVELELLNARVVPEALFVRAKKARLRLELTPAQQSLEYLKGTEYEARLRRAIESMERQLKDPKNFRGLREKILRKQQQNFTPEAIAAAVAAAPKAKSKRPATVKLPPLPPLKWDGVDQWEGKDVLKSWSGFRAGGGGKGSSGKMTISVAGTDEEDDDGNAPPPAKEQVAAYKHVKQNERAIRDAVLKAVFAEFMKMKRRGDFDDLEDEVPALATVNSAADLKRHVEPYSVHMLDHAKSGHAYVGMDFGCTWDEEHGLGVLLHKSRVVKVGQAEMSFDHHAAKRDGAKRIR